MANGCEPASLTCKYTEQNIEDKLILSSESLHQDLVRFSDFSGYKKHIPNKVISVSNKLETATNP